jgi:hypothetical protein
MPSSGSVPLRGWVFATAKRFYYSRLRNSVSVPLRGWVFATQNNVFRKFADVSLQDEVSVPLRGWVFATNPTKRNTQFG